MKIVVSIPTYNTPPVLLRRSVQSVLQQTHDDVLVVVVWDGGSRTPLGLSDARLIEFGWEENYGRFFADAVVTQALALRENVLWKPHDADDWSEPYALELLAKSQVDGVSFSPHFIHETGREPRVQRLNERILHRPRKPRRLHTARMIARKLKRGGVRIPSQITNVVSGGASWCSGLYSLERVARAGGVHPEFRTSYDSMFVRLVAKTGGVGFTMVPTYHYDRRGTESLTKSRKSSTGSKMRERNFQRLVVLDTTAWRADDPGDAVRASINQSIAAQVTRFADELESVLAPALRV